MLRVWLWAASPSSSTARPWNCRPASARGRWSAGSRCTPVRTPARRSRPSCGRTSRRPAHGPACAPRCGRCAAPGATVTDDVARRLPHHHRAAPRRTSGWTPCTSSTRRRGAAVRRACPSGELLPGVDDEWARAARDEHRAATQALAQRRTGRRASEAEDWPQALRWAQVAVRAGPAGRGRSPRPAAPAGPGGGASRGAARRPRVQRAAAARARRPAVPGHPRRPVPGRRGGAHRTGTDRLRSLRRARRRVRRLVGGRRRARPGRSCSAGEAGIGKSTLVAELARPGRRQGWPRPRSAPESTSAARRLSRPGSSWPGRWSLRSPAAAAHGILAGRPQPAVPRARWPARPPRAAGRAGRPGDRAAADLRGRAAAGRVVLRPRVRC